MATAPTRLRRAGFVALAVVVAVGGLFGLIAFFGGRDSSTFEAVKGPGRAFPDQGNGKLKPGEPRPRYNSDPPTSGPHATAPVRRDGVRLSEDQVLTALERGDVVLVYSRPAHTAALRRLAGKVAGPFSPALADAGQAVVLDLDRGRGERGVTAAAWRHLQRARSPSDPALRDFADFWLGHGARGRGAG